MWRVMRRQKKIASLESRRMAVQPPRVLLAENDAELRRELALALGHCGYEVLEAADGHAVLEQLGTHLVQRDPPELIIADVRLPGCGGPALLELVQKMGWVTPVILIMTFGDPKSHAEALRLGAAAVFLVDEPFDVDDLCAFARGVVRPD